MCDQPARRPMTSFHSPPEGRRTRLASRGEQKEGKWGAPIWLTIHRPTDTGSAEAKSEMRSATWNVPDINAAGQLFISPPISLPLEDSRARGRRINALKKVMMRKLWGDG